MQADDLSDENLPTYLGVLKRLACVGYLFTTREPFS